MDLKNRFHTLLEKYTSAKEVTILWNQLHNAYTEKHREYHNLNHLEELFNYFDKYQNEIQNNDAVAFGIFYHDYVYEVWRKDNEEKSAKKATEILQQINFPFQYLKIVEDLIISTKNHTRLTPDQGFMIDFDLAILGQSQEIYTSYTQKIREEYKIVPAIIYKQGRKKVLNHFLEKDNIFQTSTLKSQFEEQARINLSQELKQL